ncbi:TIR domain-containing protein [Coleofasciculus sp. FACHB-SPT9]|uniref:TIR domain-containing protein n=1 Tax=Cyanophyceae TaxID=3028117 RepID=UPI0016832F39|nr:TIR domain-containing protein [Coleofasciculus sp. FACHB-SPT9]
MSRSVFFSFHYQRDIFRVNIVRNHAMTKGGYQAAGYWDHSLWEAVKKEGDLAIKRMINQGLQSTSVTIVLIGSETAGRRWVQYELEQSYERGNGMLGIYIHNIPNIKGQKDLKGLNPFSLIYTTRNNKLVSLANLYPTYNWVADEGYNNFSKWVESAARAAGK